MIKSFKHKGLKELFETGQSKKIPHIMQKRALMILDVLDATDEPKGMDVSGLDFHGLKGARKACYAVKVTGNYRITFAWDNGAIIVNLEDYH